MIKLKAVAAFALLSGAVMCGRAYYVVTFAVGYGFSEADRNQRIFLYGGISFGILLFVCLASLFIDLRRNR